MDNEGLTEELLQQIRKNEIEIERLNEEIRVILHLPSEEELKRLTVPTLKDIIYHHYDEKGKSRPKFLWKFRKPDLIKFIQDERIMI